MSFRNSSLFSSEFSITLFDCLVRIPTLDMKILYLLSQKSFQMKYMFVQRCHGYFLLKLLLCRYFPFSYTSIHNHKIPYYILPRPIQNFGIWLVNNDIRARKFWILTWEKSILAQVKHFPDINHQSDKINQLSGRSTSYINILLNQQIAYYFHRLKNSH